MEKKAPWLSKAPDARAAVRAKFALSDRCEAGLELKAKEGTRFGKSCYRLQRAGDYKRATLWVVTSDGSPDKGSEFGESGEFAPCPPMRENNLPDSNIHACNGVEQTHQSRNTHQSPGYEEF